MQLGKEPSSEMVYFFLFQASGISGAPLVRAQYLAVVEIKPDSGSASLPMAMPVQILKRIARKLCLAQLMFHVRNGDYLAFSPKILSLISARCSELALSSYKSP